jgi:hypothetical protein
MTGKESPQGVLCLAQSSNGSQRLAIQSRVEVSSGPELRSRGGKGKGVASCVCVLFCVSVPASRFSESAGLYPFGDHVSLLSLSAQGF